jgi:hypothetical protein
MSKPTIIMWFRWHAYIQIAYTHTRIHRDMLFWFVLSFFVGVCKHCLLNITIKTCLVGPVGRMLHAVQASLALHSAFKTFFRHSAFTSTPQGRNKEHAIQAEFRSSQAQMWLRQVPQAVQTKNSGMNNHMSWVKRYVCACVIWYACMNVTAAQLHEIYFHYVYVFAHVREDDNTELSTLERASHSRRLRVGGTQIHVCACTGSLSM